MQYGCCISVADVSTASDFGYDFCELSGKEIASFNDIEWNKKSHEILSFNIPVHGFNSFCSDELPLVGPNVSSAAQDAYIDRIVDRGASLKISSIGIGAPKARILPDGFPIQQADEQMISFLHRICLKAEEKRINVLLEALNPYVCNYCNTMHQAAAICSQCNEQNLYLVYDVYHSILSGETYEEAEKYFDQVKHIHVCSWDRLNRNRYFLQSKDVSYIEQFGRILHECQYEGSISIEAKGNQIHEQGKEALSLMKKYF